MGKAITYLLRHWKGLTAFLREAGAPLDNNLCNADCRIMPRREITESSRLFFYGC
jgi:hypothetical protein